MRLRRHFGIVMREAARTATLHEIVDVSDLSAVQKIELRVNIERNAGSASAAEMLQRIQARLTELEALPQAERAAAARTQDSAHYLESPRPSVLAALSAYTAHAKASVRRPGPGGHCEK